MPAVAPPPGRIILVRHGETAWSATGRHTGRADVPLTERGEAQARALAPALAGRPFVRVVTSPLSRARRTAELAGLQPDGADDDLREWDYGEVEGLTAAQWRRDHPGWWLWRDGCRAGETVEEVAVRAERVLHRVTDALEEGDVALVAHGHLLRVLAVRWLQQPPQAGSRLRLDVASLSVLGHEHDLAVLLLWNAPALPGVLGPPPSPALRSGGSGPSGEVDGAHR